MIENAQQKGGARLGGGRVRPLPQAAQANIERAKA
jgi:hypothetical protein